jgi:hypothetical protein
MRAVGHTVGGVLLCVVAGAMPALAQSQIAPIVIRPAKEQPNCQIYLKADGSRLLFKGKPVSPGGACPAEWWRGTVTRFGSETYRLQIPAKKADCIVTPQGLGRCQPGMIEDPPRTTPPKPLPSEGRSL